MTRKPFVHKSPNSGLWYVSVTGCYTMSDYFTSQAEAFRYAERTYGRQRRTR